MIHEINDRHHPGLIWIKDDPVRPEIPVDFRVDRNRFVLQLLEPSGPYFVHGVQAVVCVSLEDAVPSAVDQLAYDGNDAKVAVFYTIWSYAPGAGTRLLLGAVDHIRSRYPQITRFVTLSPKTEMARKFHIKNGAVVFRENTDTVNYEYLIGTD